MILGFEILNANTTQHNKHNTTQHNTVAGTTHKEEVYKLYEYPEVGEKWVEQ